VSNETGAYLPASQGVIAPTISLIAVLSAYIAINQLRSHRPQTTRKRNTNNTNNRRMMISQSLQILCAADRVFSLHEIIDAHRYLEQNEQRGKIIVRVTARGGTI